MTSGETAEYGDPLTPREEQVMVTYAFLGTRQAAAIELGITRDVVKKHLVSAYRKLGASSGIQAFTRLRIGGSPLDRNERPDKAFDLDLNAVAEKIAENVINKIDNEFDFELSSSRTLVGKMVKHEVESELRASYPDLWSRSDAQIDEAVASR